jgi:uncharacterized membrane protein
LLPLGWVNADARGINNNGEVVGSGYDGTGLRKGGKVFIYSGGKYTFLSPDGYSAVVATGINDSGKVIGCEPVYRGFPVNGFIYSDGTFTYLPPRVIPFGINNKGVVVGSKTDDYGMGFFIATPITTLK